MFITKEGIVRGRGAGSGGPFALLGTVSPNKDINLQLKNEENAHGWNKWGKVSEKGYRIDIEDGSRYYYVVPENTKGP